MERIAVQGGTWRHAVAVTAAITCASVALWMFAPKHIDAQTANTEFEGENMSGIALPQSEVISDVNGSGGQAAGYWANDTLSKGVTTIAAVDRVVLRLRGRDACDGLYPQATLKIDGSTIGAKDVTNNAQGGSFASYTYALSSSLAAGSHTVEVAFTNNRWVSSSCDRKVYLDKVTLEAAPVVYFSDNFDRSADTFVPPWTGINAAAADRLVTDSATKRRGTHSMKMTAYDSDIYPSTYTSDPRAQVEKPELFCNSDERYIGFSVYFPSSFPILPSGGWLVFSEYGWRDPGGAPPTRFVVDANNKLVLARDEQYNHDRIWDTPLAKGVWIDLVAHIKFHEDPALGFVELWKDSVQQTFTDGSTRKYYKTLQPGQTGCGSLDAKNYRKAGMFQSSVLYQDEVKVGNSYASVAP